MSANTAIFVFFIGGGGTGFSGGGCSSGGGGSDFGGCGFSSGGGGTDFGGGGFSSGGGGCGNSNFGGADLGGPQLPNYCDVSGHSTTGFGYASGPHYGHAQYPSHTPQSTFTFGQPRTIGRNNVTYVGGMPTVYQPARPYHNVSLQLYLCEEYLDFSTN